jgi:hypothetical protein
MNNFLLRILKFTLSLTITWGVLWCAAASFSPIETLFIAVRSNEGAVNLKSEEFLDLPANTHLDYLFLGSSTCYCGIDPHALLNENKTAFSLCSSAQRIGNSAALLNFALEHTAPQHVVVDIYPQLWSTPASSIECERDWIVNATSVSLPLETISPYNALLNLYFSLSPEGTSAPSNPSDTYMGLGFVSRDKQPLDSLDCPTKTRRTMPTELEAILLSMSERSDLILLIPPVLCPAEYTIPKSLNGLRVVDGGVWPGASNSNNFYDDHHLNSSGAASYSGWLAEELTRLDADPSL